MASALNKYVLYRLSVVNTHFLLVSLPKHMVNLYRIGSFKPLPVCAGGVNQSASECYNF